MAGELGPSIVAAVAALTGALGGFITGLLARRSTETIAAAQRDLSARELAARAFARARTAVWSLHAALVEDVGDFQPISDYVADQVAARRETLRQALFDLDQVSALLSGTPTGQKAATVARHLAVLDDAWRIAPQSMQSLPPHMLDSAQEDYARAMRDIRSSRKALLGHMADTGPTEAGDLHSGLLGELAKEIGRDARQ